MGIYERRCKARNLQDLSLKIKEDKLYAFAVLGVFAILFCLFLTRGYGTTGMICVTSALIKEYSVSINMETGKKEKIWHTEPVDGNNLSADGKRTIGILRNSAYVDGTEYHYDTIKEYNWETGKSEILLEDNKEECWAEPHELKTVSYFGAETIGFVWEKNKKAQTGIYNLQEKKTYIVTNMPENNIVKVEWANDGKTIYVVYGPGIREGLLCRYEIRKKGDVYELVNEKIILEDVGDFAISHNQKYVCYSNAYIHVPKALYLYDIETDTNKIFAKIGKFEFHDLGYSEFGFSPDNLNIWYITEPYLTTTQGDLSFLLIKSKLYIHSIKKAKSKQVYKGYLMGNPIWFPKYFKVQ